MRGPPDVGTTSFVLHEPLEYRGEAYNNATLEQGMHTMRRAVKRTDISHLPEMLRLAEEVQRSKQPQILHDGDQAIAMLTPLGPEAPTKKAAKRHGRATPARKSILNLVGIADEATPPDDATDVSSNKHKYLADAYYAEFHRPSER